MRTTIDLPPALHRLASDRAKETGQSISATLAQLVAKGAEALGAFEDQAGGPSTHPVTGFPVVSYGSPITAAEAAKLAEDD
jgi:hypothetical protein